MEIRKTCMEDFERVMEIYAGARDFMASTGNPVQWGATNWPPEALIREDITHGKSFVCMDEDVIAAVFFYDHGKGIDSNYDYIEDGQWIGSDEYGVVHRIASAHTVKEAGAYCINWAFEQCHHLRIDTHKDNTVMRNLLKKLGFVYCGIIYVREDNDPRMAFEKI
jgi:RimJ/RimL family protein N-acetyltransferase